MPESANNSPHPWFICAFCGQSPGFARRIAGPGVAICDTCIQAALDLRSPQAVNADDSVRPSMIKCSFCGASSSQRALSSDQAAMCVGCLELAQTLLAEKRAKARGRQ